MTHCRHVFFVISKLHARVKIRLSYQPLYMPLGAWFINSFFPGKKKTFIRSSLFKRVVDSWHYWLPGEADLPDLISRTLQKKCWRQLTLAAWTIDVCDPPDLHHGCLSLPRLSTPSGCHPRHRLCHFWPHQNAAHALTAHQGTVTDVYDLSVCRLQSLGLAGSNHWVTCMFGYFNLHIFLWREYIDNRIDGEQSWLYVLLNQMHRHSHGHDTHNP